MPVAKPLSRVRRAASRRVSASAEYRAAIDAAHTEGHSTREIAAAAGVSHAAVVQLLQRQR